MKNSADFKLIYTLLFILLLNPATIRIFSQWQPEVRISNNSQQSWMNQSNAKCIAAAGNLVHILWQDNRDGNWELYYKRSPDNGLSWSDEMRLTNNSSVSELPAICAEGNFVYITWCDSRDGNKEIYFKKSVNGGLNWLNDTRLTFNTSVSTNPAITLVENRLNLVWQDNTEGNYEIYSYYSTNGGLNWSSFIRLTNNASSSEMPNICSYESKVYCVWQDNRDGNFEIYSKRSTNGGVNWTNEQRVTNNTFTQERPSVAAYGANVFLVWQDIRDGNNEVYYNNSINSGIYWETERRLTNDIYFSASPSLTVSGSTLHLVWHDDRNGLIQAEIYYKRSPDNGVSWSGDTRITNAGSVLIQPSVAVSGSYVHVAWQDSRDGIAGEIYYKNNPTANPFGIINISSEIPLSSQLLQNYPNPFNPVTKIRFDIQNRGYVMIKVFDINGKEVSSLAETDLSPGTYETEWNASDFSSGVYFYKMICGDYIVTKKMLLLK